jgi:4-alpha-glucanotransferase
MILPMNFDLFIRFSTFPGQKLMISGNIPSLGGNHGIQYAVPMEYYDKNHWKISFNVSKEDFKQVHDLVYTFYFIDNEGNITEDWSKNRSLTLKDIKKNCTLIETWINMGDIENIYHTAPFQQIFDPVQLKTKPISPKKGKSIITVDVPLLPEGYKLAITGGSKYLGNWTKEGFITMKQNGSIWMTDLDADQFKTEVEYKYILVDQKNNLIRYEHGDNRTFRIPSGASTETLIIRDGFTRFQFQSRAAGIAIPVFSLRTHDGLGVGEFNDIKKLVDWARSVSIKMIQLLPVNDTTSTHSKLDSYPYAAISAYALHPLYGSIETIAGKKYAKVIEHLVASKHQLNLLPGVDYEAVMELKWEAYSLLYHVMAEESFGEEDYTAFFQENKHWLVPYAAYSYLRDTFGTPDASKWGKYTDFNDALIKELCEPGTKQFDAIALHYFIQYHLHLQLKFAHDYANQNGLILKGDIAIGVHRNGADTWTQPDLYHLDKQAGAPPDDFAIKGQNWGFPTYNWEAMKADGFAWWKSRFEQMANYFDAFRIDHILGFFRIWSIPEHATEGIMGRFVPAIPIYRDEFERHGIQIDEKRYCEPFITDQVLWELANGMEGEVKHFLHHLGNGDYRFKEEFNTQRKIDAYFNASEECDHKKCVKEVLMGLHSNVILWKDESMSNAYHFRFNIGNTVSFRHLSTELQDKLNNLYNIYFFHRQENIWRKEAMEKLPSLKYCTDMLICGEDLGLVPGCVPDVMSKLGFLSMEVQRMPKQQHVKFFDPATAPYLSVVTPSTHDMSTLREWWLENKSTSQHFYREQLWQQGNAPEQADTHIIKAIVLQHLASPAMWSVFQMQDLLAMSETYRADDPHSERINIPGDAKHYWRYRLPFNIEELHINDTFNEELKYFISSNGR